MSVRRCFGAKERKKKGGRRGKRNPSIRTFLGAMILIRKKKERKKDTYLFEHLWGDDRG